MLLALFIIYETGLIITLHYCAKKPKRSEAVYINGQRMLNITYHLIRLISVILIGVNGIVLARKLFVAGMSDHPQPERLTRRHTRVPARMASWVQLIFEDINVDSNERIKVGHGGLRRAYAEGQSLFQNKQITNILSRTLCGI